MGLLDPVRDVKALKDSIMWMVKNRMNANKWENMPEIL
jgi:hypothetical protein